MGSAKVLSVLAVCGALLGAGCSNAPQKPAQTFARAPAPAAPDFTPTVERFYQQVEGAHWTIAYAMLSERYRATLSRAQLEERYRALGNAEIRARQIGSRKVVARIIVPAERPITLRESITFAWDGEEWTIDDIARTSP